MIIEGVIVVGAGPVGLWAAAELALAGIPTVVLERAQERSPHSKALGLHARTLELLAMRGVQAEFLAEGRAFPYWHFGMLPARIDLHSLDTPFPFMLALPQRRTEELLEQRALELDVSILRGRTVVGLTQDEHAVTLDVLGPDGPVKMAAPFVIGADGSRSVVRDLAGIGFPGTETTAYGFIGEVILDEPPADSSISRHSAEGALIMVPLGEGRYRLAGVDARRQGPDDELTFAALQETIIRMLGTDLGMRDPSWLTRFPDRTCLAETYRRGRVLLAGDSAHIHWPAGGVGLNVGVQDAMNLGWKLAAEMQGRAASGLLDSYHAERHPVGRDLVQHTLAQGALINATSASGQALRAVLSDLLAMHPDAIHNLARKLSGLEVAYAPADPQAHPLVGTRAPNLLLADGRTGLFQQMTCGREVLVINAGPDAANAVGSAKANGLATVELSLTEDRAEWADVELALIRPDGHVGWATNEFGEAAMPPGGFTMS